MLHSLTDKKIEFRTENSYQKKEKPSVSNVSDQGSELLGDPDAQEEVFLGSQQELKNIPES